MEDFECDEKYFSVHEGRCIDVSIPGSIPNEPWAPTAKLSDAEKSLFPAPYCQVKSSRRVGCYCAKGLDALEYGFDGQPKGDCGR